MVLAKSTNALVLIDFQQTNLKELEEEYGDENFKIWVISQVLKAELRHNDCLASISGEGIFGF